MATILQISQLQPFPPVFLETTESPAEPAISGFQQILDLACERIDQVFGVPERPFEQRAVTRKRIALRAQCVGEWGASPCLVSDVSEGGMAFVCGHLHDVGDQVTLRWETSYGSTVQVDCTVRHVTGPYIGVQFLAPTPEQRWGIRSLGVGSEPEQIPFEPSQSYAA